MSSKRRLLGLGSLALLVAVLLSAVPGRSRENGLASPELALAKKILADTGVSGGLVVHLGCGDGKLTAALRAGPGYRVPGLDGDASRVAAARRHLRSLGVYGPVAVDRLHGKTLPYVDDSVNLVIAEGLTVTEAEVLRVLAPGGVVYRKKRTEWEKQVKPRPKNHDKWTHYLHDATGNQVAHDDVVGRRATSSGRHGAATGKPLWSAPHALSGYESPEDLIVAARLVWCAPPPAPPTALPPRCSVLCCRGDTTGKPLPANVAARPGMR
jgi:SAM-dependent methyltransferase